MTDIQIAEALHLNNHTVGTRINDLKNREYIIQERKYYLVPKPDYYTLIPQNTLNFLLCYMGDQDKIIKLYVVMWDKWVCNRAFTISDLHRDLGYSLKK